MPKTRLVVFETDVESGCRSVHDIVELECEPNIADVRKFLPRVRMSTYSYADSRRHWIRLLDSFGEEDGMTLYTFKIEKVDSRLY